MKNILWVDDEIELLKPHIIYLQSKGYNLTTAKSGDEALDIIENASFNLIFLDENMPGLSGLETLNIIKDKYQNIPVVMITKSEEESIMEEAIGSKISDYLKERGMPVKEVACYKRSKFESYENIKENFYKADAIIFPSNFAAEIYFQEIHNNEIEAIFFGISKRIINCINSLGHEAYMVDYFSGNLEKSVAETISSL